MTSHEQVVYILNEQYPGLSPTQFGFQECHPGHSFGPCVRPFWLLHYVISGTGTFTRSGITHQITPGEIFVIPPGMFFLDIDHKKISDPLVQEMLQKFDSYSEFSVSGEGIHIYGLCD
ncbi:MAG: AraC family ligand binding domain-containing protein, partial [Clostridia bacterium]|nr:AraC family ligand binding domain-containing protein [Clostridia bacterium]